MIKGGVCTGSGVLFPPEPHTEFLELCAVSTSGQLTEEERKRLQEHLALCPSCRETLRQYEATVHDIIPAIAAHETTDEAELDSAWSPEEAEKAFFQRLESQEKAPPDNLARTEDILVPRRLLPFSPESTWRHVWMLYAAGILLFVTISFCVYWAGIRRGSSVAKFAAPQVSTQEALSLEAQLSDASHEREVARAQIAEYQRTIADLRRQLSQQLALVSELKSSQQHSGLDKNNTSVEARDASGRDSVQERRQVAQLEEAQANSRALQAKLDSLSRQSAADTEKAKTLEAKVADLTRLLEDREAALNEKDELLAHDRDIRELMGARDLYIAEVHDVGRNGETQKPYGRVFYTRGKSLIFYAYDLDQQTALKKASAFQAWGRRGPEWGKAINLGIFYEDNASKKRWILKCDDPATLSQIDAVFVTVEPNGGSRKPSGKSLLFAYLKVDPNHP